MTTEDVGVVLFCIICVYGKEERINSVSHINPLFLNAVSQKRIHVIAIGQYRHYNRIEIVNLLLYVPKRTSQRYAFMWQKQMVGK